MSCDKHGESHKPASEAAPPDDFDYTQLIMPPKYGGRAARIALTVLVALMLTAAVAALVWVRVVNPQQDIADDDALSTTTEGSLTVSISQVINESFPTVTLYASILDENGETADNLAAGDFKIVELSSDGTEYEANIQEFVQLAASDAMSINLVLDLGESMGEDDKLESAQTAVLSFLDDVAANEGTEVEITSFGSSVYTSQSFTTDQTLLESAVSQLSPSGTTALHDALYWALERTDLANGSRVVIAFTDGIEDAGNYSTQDIVELSKLTGIPIYIVGIGDDVEESDLSNLAQACNGSYFGVSTEDLTMELFQIYRRIYTAQQAMYRIVFESSYTGDESAFRTVQLEGSGTYVCSAEIEYVPVDNVSSDSSNSSDSSDVTSNEYILLESDSRYYSRDELASLSTWELYLARNEIYARHGRGFTNQDLADYFASCSWYQELYTAEEFDAMSSPLNEYERANVALLRSIEEELESSYLN